MSRTHSKARVNRKIAEGISAREQEIINILFDEFIKCLKPKPRWIPQKWWTWFVTKYIFDLNRLPQLKPERHAQINQEIKQNVAL